MDFGFSNNRQATDEISAWRAAAIADGWTATPTYSTESIDRATCLTRDGFVAHVITRPMSGKYLYEAKLHLWAPDGMACKPPQVYDWSVIAGGQRRCIYCEADDVETHRVGWAGRACATCLPKERARAERPGWDA